MTGGGPLEGVTVVEVASWTFVPAAGAILADLGADVIKVEPPGGDPQRGLQNLLNFGVRGANPFLEIPNRGKRSVTLDLNGEAGREVLRLLVAEADVFVTSNLEPVRRRLRIDVDDIRAVNPRIIYVRGSGWGNAGPMADRGGLDLASAWASSGLAYRLTPDGGEPPMQPAAFFDLQGATTIAGAVAMALFKRERSGESSVVDVALMHVGMWPLSPDIVGAPAVGGKPTLPSREQPGNPIVNWYRTADDRWLYLVCLQADRFWPELCTLLDRPDLIADPRFVDAAARYQHRGECVSELDAVFATHPLSEWSEVLAGFSGVWAPVQTFAEIHQHAQVEANGFLAEVEPEGRDPFRLVAAPMQFDGVRTAPRGAAPELGEHTELVLLERGIDWDGISAFRERGAFGPA